MVEQMQTWYQTLITPWWAPPTKAFGIAWGIIYPIIFVTFGYVFYLLSKGEITWKIALPFIINLAFNLSFTSIQFGLRNQNLALLWMFIIVGTLIWAVIKIYPIKPVLAWAQLPYLLWGLFATALQTSIWWYN